MNHSIMKVNRQYRAMSKFETKQDRSALINRNPQTILRELLFEQNVQLYRLQQAKNNKCIMFLQIPMSCQYSLDIPDIDEYFGNKDKIYNKKIQDYKRKVNSCRNRLEKLKFRINDQQIQEDEYQDINKQQKIKQINNDNQSQEKKDYFYYKNRIHTTINENYQLKSNQVNKFNQKLYSLMSNRDRSLEQKSQRLKNIIQGQKYLDDTQNELKKSRNYIVQQSIDHKLKLFYILKSSQKQQDSIDIEKKIKLEQLRDQIANGYFTEI